MLGDEDALWLMESERANGRVGADALACPAERGFRSQFWRVDRTVVFIAGTIFQGATPAGLSRGPAGEGACGYTNMAPPMLNRH